jgi:hypothetical protein
MTTRRISDQGLKEKTRELDDKKTGPLEIEAIREAWAEILKGFGFDLEHRAAHRVDDNLCQTPPPVPKRNQVVRPGNAPPPRLSL